MALTLDICQSDGDMAANVSGDLKLAVHFAERPRGFRHGIQWESDKLNFRVGNLFSWMSTHVV